MPYLNPLPWPSEELRGDVPHRIVLTDGVTAGITFHSSTGKGVFAGAAANGISPNRPTTIHRRVLVWAFRMGVLDHPNAIKFGMFISDPLHYDVY